eukprot:TRINITY_DN3710_c0_g1_i7.p1 TRINITY_DN3710_c0_g1~~TRINITY_DN3710_c0_g1_i7.p1  ORF type:complete len:137 (-),score=6.74 TRINITY_DN3710_c0_g1_i7:312-722(-)
MHMFHNWDGFVFVVDLKELLKPYFECDTPPLYEAGDTLERFGCSRYLVSLYIAVVCIETAAFCQHVAEQDLGRLFWDYHGGRDVEAAKKYLANVFESRCHLKHLRRFQCFFIDVDNDNDIRNTFENISQWVRGDMR